jgi:hypothetical protein
LGWAPRPFLYTRPPPHSCRSPAHMCSSLNHRLPLSDVRRCRPPPHLLKCVHHRDPSYCSLCGAPKPAPTPPFFPLYSVQEITARPVIVLLSPREFPSSQSRRRPPHTPPLPLDHLEHRSLPPPRRISTKTLSPSTSFNELHPCPTSLIPATPHAPPLHPGATGNLLGHRRPTSASTGDRTPLATAASAPSLRTHFSGETSHPPHRPTDVPPLHGSRAADHSAPEPLTSGRGPRHLGGRGRADRASASTPQAIFSRWAEPVGCSLGPVLTRHCSLFFQYLKSFPDSSILKNSIIFLKCIEN